MREVSMRMGVLTRYLDLLPPAARDRILHAERWTTLCHVDESGARNVMGHAENWSWKAGAIPNCGEPDVFRLRAAAGDVLWTDEPRIGAHFEGLVRRRGLKAAVALICARLMSPKPQPNLLRKCGHLKLVD